MQKNSFPNFSHIIKYFYLICNFIENISTLHIVCNFLMSISRTLVSEVVQTLNNFSNFL